MIARVAAFGQFVAVGSAFKAQKDLFDVIALMQSNYNVDKDHIFLTGASMGGSGT